MAPRTVQLLRGLRSAQRNVAAFNTFAIRMNSSYSGYSGGGGYKPAGSTTGSTGGYKSSTSSSTATSSTPATAKPTGPVFPAASGSVLASTSAAAASGENMLNDPTSNWTSSYHGLSVEPFSKEAADILMAPISVSDIEMKPDGLLYLPEIKYRRILNRAFGPGGWGLAPRGEHSVSPRTISREYALVCHGRFVAQARGEQDYFDPDGLATASEGCKSNALMRCCKDLGVASELWDPSFIRKFKKENCVEVMAEHMTTKRRKKLWRLKSSTIDYPYKEVSSGF